MARQKPQRSQFKEKDNSQKSQRSQFKEKDNSQSHGHSQPFHLEFLNQAQKMAWGAFDQHDVLFLLGPAGCGKALTMNSRLFTRSGPIRMADVKIGLEIANPDGSFSKITGVFPQGQKQICRVHFSDETYVDCCEEHLWSISHADNGWKNKIVDTSYLEKNCRRKDGKRVLSIKTTKPVNFDRNDYVIPAYVMGVLLSEGNITNSNVVFTSCESEIVQNISSLLPEGYECKTKGLDHRIVKSKRSNKKNIYKEELKKLSLWGCRSYEKFIPNEYLYGAVDQRISLLQGLMDGDGGVEKTGVVVYSTTSYQLAKDFCLLVNSLGGTTRISRKEGSLKEDGSRHRISYRCYVNLPSEINVFFLRRKARLIKARSKYVPKRYIDRVERLGMEDMQCISVDHKDSLYLTDNFTVTHNTHLACAFAISEILSKRKKKCVLTRPIVEAGEALGFLPGTFDEKVSPYMMPMYDCIEKCVGKEGPQREIIDRSVEVAPIAYMRGRTFDNAVCIFDEAQNATVSQLKLFMTRFGQNSKIIITGDPNQSDLRQQDQGLMHVVNRVQDLQGIGVISFKASSIVRHPLIASILEKLEG